MDVGEILEELKNKALSNEGLMQELLKTRNSPSSVTDFCKVAREAGLELYEMDMIAFGEDSYAAMRRSTNGGGENAPLLKWENDAYEMFMAELEMIRPLKLCVIFPGMGYTCDKPLLYYPGKYFRSLGYDIVNVSYTGLPDKVRGDKDNMKQSFDMALDQVSKQLSDIDWKKYSDIIFIGKSIGTALATYFGGTLKNVDIRYILLTPLAETFSFANSGKAIAFTGTADPWADTDELTQLSKEKDIPLYIYESANHSLETGDIDKDIETVRNVFGRIDMFIRM